MVVPLSSFGGRLSFYEINGVFFFLFWEIFVCLVFTINPNKCTMGLRPHLVQDLGKLAVMKHLMHVMLMGQISFITKFGVYNC